MLTIEYWNDSNDLDIRYSNGFRQIFYLDAIMSHPEYPMDEEGTEDAEGLFNATWHKWRKTYHIHFIAPEYVVDAMQTLPYHDNVFIDGLKVKDISVNVGWDGLYGVVDMSFVTDEFIRGTCCYKMKLTLALQTYSPIPGGECYSPNLDPVISGVLSTSDIFTDPMSNGVSHGDRYMVVTAIDVFDATVQGAVYEWVIDKWVEDVASEGYGVYVPGVGNMYYDGTWWNAYPYIAMIDQSGVDTYHITGFALPETWVTVQYSPDDITWTDASDPIWSDAFNTMGLTVNVTEGDYYWRITSHTWSCTYDPLNEKYKESGFWLINDAGDYFTQNAANDKWYR